VAVTTRSRYYTRQLSQNHVKELAHCAPAREHSQAIALTIRLPRAAALLGLHELPSGTIRYAGRPDVFDLPLGREGQCPPRKAFPSDFKEKFNVKFDHVQHMTGSARPEKGCVACHDRSLNRGVALSIPAAISAHSQCYVCHIPTSKSAAGREIASCGVCHNQKAFVRSSTNALAYREGFSHSKHGPRQRLECAACHTLTAGVPQSRQVSSPRAAEHFATVGGMTCMTCHNGRRSFGGDLAFKECKRCHAGPTFRTPI
jgi:hypothetical protein